MINGTLTECEQEVLAQLGSEYGIEGRLARIEHACVVILDKAGLPTKCGNYECDTTGNWRAVGSTEPKLLGARLRTDRPWTIAQRRGFSIDSLVGFASRMVLDIAEIRHGREHQKHDDVALGMYFLGVKYEASRIKEQHGTNSRPIKPARTRDRDIGLAREFIQRKSAGTNLSDSALKQDIGAKQSRPLKRSSSIEAIDRGLQVLSGGRA
jgi:hypothetical protein